MYYSLNDFFRKKFGEKVYKLALDIDTTCPNRDGSKGVGGCIFCAENGSGGFSSTNIDDAIANLKNKARGKYIAYYQSYSNTYCSVEFLSGHVNVALSREDIVGIAIATRPDCISDEMYQFLRETNDKTFLTIELGLQTIRDDIGQIHNRCHTYQDFLVAYNKLKELGIRVTVHIINGLIGENEQDMLNTARALANLNVDGVKIHCIHVVKGTILADLYWQGKVIIPTLEEYSDIVVKQIAILPKSTVVERITGDGERNKLIAPMWSLRKRVVLNTINAKFARLGISQGDMLNEKCDENS